MTNKQALREAAEKAGAEVWCAFIDTKSKTYAVHTPDDDRCGDVVKWPGLDGQQRAAAKARFIAAANPATVLALLDELEAKDKAWTAQDNHINQQADRIESLEKKNGELGRALGAAQKRIAELEAKQVVLPQRISMEGGSYCTAHARHDEEGDFYYRDEVIESLVAAGIRINGEG